MMERGRGGVWTCEEAGGSDVQWWNVTKYKCDVLEYFTGDLLIFSKNI